MKTLFFSGIAAVKSLAVADFRVGCDFSVSTRRLFTETKEFLFQNTLEAFLPVRTSAEEFLKEVGKSTRNLINATDKSDLVLEWSQSLDDLRFFYDTMLVPFAKQRHAEKFWLPPFEEFSSLFPHHLQLCFAVKNDTRVAGEVFLHTPALNKLTEWRFGVSEAASRDAKLVSACNNWMTWQFYKRALEMKISKISVGQVVARVDDGIYKFKCKWNADFQNIAGYPWYALRFHSEKSVSILAHVPLITWQGGAPVALFSVSNQDELQSAFDTMSSGNFEGLKVALYFAKNMASSERIAEVNQFFKNVMILSADDLTS